MNEIERTGWSVSTNYSSFVKANESLLKQGSLELVTFPVSGKSLTIAWSEEPHPKLYTQESYKIWGKFYYDQRLMTLHSIYDSRIISHSGQENTNYEEEKNVSQIPCALLIFGKITQQPGFLKLDLHEDKEDWSLHIPYYGAEGGMYNPIIGSSISYKFHLGEDEVSCTYVYKYYADLEP